MIPSKKKTYNTHYDTCAWCNDEQKIHPTIAFAYSISTAAIYGDNRNMKHIIKKIRNV